MFKFAFNFLRRFECINRYQGPVDWSTADKSTKTHINTSFIMALIATPLGFIHPLFMLVYLVAFLCYSPIMELAFQYHKEKDKRVWNIMAQMFERGIGFAFCLPLWVGVLIASLLGVRWV